MTKHLVALREAGLVEATRSGRETRYTLTPTPLSVVAGWIEDVGSVWEERLARLKRLVEERREAPS